jgi:hypothetical protein
MFTPVSNNYVGQFSVQIKNTNPRTSYLFFPFIEVVSYATLRSAYFPKGLRPFSVAGLLRRMKRPEAPRLAGRYVARASHRGSPNTCLRVAASAKAGMRQNGLVRHPRCFNLSNVSLFVNNLINSIATENTEATES